MQHGILRVPYLQQYELGSAFSKQGLVTYPQLPFPNLLLKPHLVEARRPHFFVFKRYFIEVLDF